MNSSVAAHTGSAGTSQNWFVAALEEARARRGAWTSAAMVSLQNRAEEAWKKVLFPSPRIEAWKYTNTEAIAKGDFVVARRAAPSIIEEGFTKLPDVASLQVVFVDGEFSAQLSSKETISGVTVTRFSELALGRNEGVAERIGRSEAHLREPFAALATSLLQDGVAIVVPPGAIVQQPLHIVHVVTKAGSGTVQVPRMLVLAGERSEIKIVESFLAAGGEGYLSLPVCEIVAEEGAVVSYYRIQREAVSAYHVSFMGTEQAANSSVNSFVASFGGRLVRNNLEVALKGSGAHSVLNGLSVLSGEQHVDNATLIHHIEPSAESREHFKGIYADRSRGVFSGTITVESEAQKTNAFQSNQALLLSGDASIETRPQLKIWADDVKCTHGATVGQIDHEALFYLRSRGIDRDTARNFLIHAFASEVLTSVGLEGVRTHMEGMLTEKLGTLSS